MSGGSRIAYWVATYTWDMIMYTAIVAITMLVFVAYQDQSFIGSWTKVGAVLALLMSFGASVIPLTYCYSFAFSNHANAQVGYVVSPLDSMLTSSSSSSGVFLVLICLFIKHEFGRIFFSKSVVKLVVINAF